MLFVKKSTIPKAGKGLFTDSLIPKDTYILEYTGDEITWDEVIKRSEAGRGGYAFYISKKKCIDAFDHPDSLARYANDARGIGRVNGLRNNAVYAIKKGKGYIQATRNIKPGEEVFVWYGPDYWDEHEAELKAFNKRVRSEATKKAWEKRRKQQQEIKKKA